MRKLFKWAGIILFALAIVLVAVVLTLSLKGSSSMKATYMVGNYDPVLPGDSLSLSRGEYLVGALCRHCHGSDLSGTAFFNDEKLGSLPAPNLTGGIGGIGHSYTPNDWIRAIRHGVSRDGKGFRIMPSAAFNHLDSADLYSMVAFLMTVPPVDKSWEEARLPFLTRVMIGMGAFGDFIPADVIDHSKPFAAAVPQAISPEYGAYLYEVSDCKVCHLADFSGGKSPDPNAPPIPAIGRASNVGNWTPEQFVSTMKSGITPEGKSLDDKFMPWTGYARYTDDDLKAIHTYLMSGK